MSSIPTMRARLLLALGIALLTAAAGHANATRASALDDPANARFPGSIVAEPATGAISATLAAGASIFALLALLVAAGRLQKECEAYSSVSRESRFAAAEACARQIQLEEHVARVSSGTLPSGVTEVYRGDSRRLEPSRALGMDRPSAGHGDAVVIPIRR